MVVIFFPFKSDSINNIFSLLKKEVTTFPHPSYQYLSQAEGSQQSYSYKKCHSLSSDRPRASLLSASYFFSSLNWFSSTFFKGPALNIYLNTAHCSQIEGKPSREVMELFY